MGPSARGARIRAAGTATLPALVLLTGCVSTQRIAARARLVDARILASQTVPAAVRADPEISVARPVVVRATGGSAIVVTLRNDSAHVLSDLPLSVGIRPRRGRPAYLNRAANLDYFQTHVASIAPHAVVTWVFTTGRRVGSSLRAFATVGFPQIQSVAGPDLPRIAVSALRSGAVSVVNRSTIPQYDLPVYAVAVRGGRVVAAGEATVAHLGTHGHTTLTVALLGNGRGAALHLTALPTIFN
ncbi:MAG: hypothetical protein JO027_22085 [Solirubrobacterales bacterium]|nr:hypothetical protein [Solirubrobacterales bacterium]